MGSKTVSLRGFPLNANSEQVKDFLNKYTADGSVLAVKVRQPKVIKTDSRAFVLVQFEKKSDADFIFNLAKQRKLCYEGSNLTVKHADRDIVPNPRTPLFELESIVLHLGCLLSNDKLGVLWSFKDVKVHFGFQMKKIHFFMSQGLWSYKLELFYESIWEMQLRRPSAQSSKFLLIQVEAAPRIYKMPLESLDLIYENPILDYFKEAPDDQWTRTTDFTSSCFIGQSSVLCLQLPCYCQLPEISQYFVFYKELDSHFDLENINSYSRDLDLVPVVEPRHTIEVPYKILFKVNQMVQNGTLMGPTLDDNFFICVSPLEFPIGLIEYALKKMSRLQSSCFDPANWLRDQYESKEQRIPQLSSALSSDEGLAYVHRVQITPCKVYFCGPEINVSNRVIRHYAEDIDNFIRVSFVDEEGDKMRSTDLAPRSGCEKHTEIYVRILNILKNGIVIGDKKFEFLAFSSSQLRESSAWMFASRRGLNAAAIRDWMGDFSQIRNVAKYAARLGQSFSSSTETLTVRRDEVEVISDVDNGTGYLFSDGIGKISTEFANKVATKCGLKNSPSAFQIRYAGYKGVVAIDPTSSKKLSLRKSMLKFESENNKLDVLAFSKCQPCFLNRQIITLLSTLGVKDRVFGVKQEKAIDELDEILSDPTKALEATEQMSPGETTSILKELLLCGYKPNGEPFVSMLLQTFRASKLSDLKTKARIFVREGRAMMGCMDETRKLKYGQVFVQVSGLGGSIYQDRGLYKPSGSETDHCRTVIKQKVVIAKNPCLHPGDVRTLLAVDVPALHHMVDCVVFPQKGKRPHPNECSGSDLDGDIYFVSWDKDLITPRKVSPMEYTPAPTDTLDHDVTIEEVEEYFTNYIVNDSLGIISNAHTVFADKQPRKAESEECIELAKLFSIAVDFPKTGVPAEIPSRLHVHEYPDFMEKLDKATYISNGIIGKLFRAVKEHPKASIHIMAFTKEVARESYDPDMEVDGFMHYVDEAFSFKEIYDYELANIMDQFEIKSEAELLLGNVIKESKKFNKYKDGEAVGLAIRSLRKKARGWFKDNSNSDDQSAEDEDELNAKASAWYHVTYHPKYWGCYNEGMNMPHFLSFAWCVYDRLVLIKQEKTGLRRMQQQLKSLRLR